MSMIKRDDNLARANPAPVGPATPPPSPAGASDLLLGAGAEFEGKLTFRGTVRIDAMFKGSIVTNDVLVVGEHARIDAEISCGTVIVHGEVNGNVKAKTAVELLRTARVRGDVETPSVRLDKGATLNGAVRMPGSKPA
jgi:cytoskeletal protein CcmA (bactofilin family)